MASIIFRNHWSDIMKREGLIKNVHAKYLARQLLLRLYYKELMIRNPRFLAREFFRVWWGKLKLQAAQYEFIKIPFRSTGQHLGFCWRRVLGKLRR